MHSAPLRFGSRDPADLVCLQPMIEGFATPEGTHRYSERFPALLQARHFRSAKVKGLENLEFSSIGLGTYLGEPDDASDQLYIQAIETAVRVGINVFDTAINYRHQRSERNVGAALQQSIHHQTSRNVVMLNIWFWNEGAAPAVKVPI